MTNFWFIFLPGDFPGMASLRWLLGVWFFWCIQVTSRHQLDAAHSKNATKDEVSTVTALTKASQKFLAFLNCSLRETCSNIFPSAQQKPRHSKLCFKKCLSKSSRVSLDDLIISRQSRDAALAENFSKSFKKNCWWHWQGMRDTLDLSSYRRELSSRIASEYQLSFSLLRISAKRKLIRFALLPFILALIDVVIMLQ